MSSGKAVPGWLNKIRFITFYAFNPCEAPFMLYIEMAREPAHRTALVFLEFDLFAMVKRFFRPIGLRQRRHGRKGSRSGRGLRGVPEIADMVAEVLPGQEEFAQRKYGVGTRLLYVLSDAYERVIWNIVLVELSTDFVYDSLLGVISSDRAKCPLIARIARAQSGAIEGGVGPAWRPHNLPELKYIKDYGSVTGFGAVCFTSKTIAVFAATCRAINLPVQVSIRLVAGPTASRVVEEASYVTLQPGESADFIVEGDIDQNELIQWQISCIGGFCTVTKSDFFGITIE